MKIATIVGNRPQFVKAASLVRSLEKTGIPSLSHLLVHTGQHYDANMSDVFFQEMEIPRPNYYLGIGGSSHGAMTGKMLERIETLLMEEKPDCVLVVGDTNTTLSGALAAVKLHIPVAHVEAGLRSFNRRMPEEINRILTDHCSTFLFSPTKGATEQLEREGISSASIHQVGDVMYDAFLYYRQRALSESNILEKLDLIQKRYVLATIHRAENTDDFDRLSEIMLGLSAIAKETPVVLPLHPRTRLSLNQWSLWSTLQKELIVVDPIGYFDMLQLECHALAILTDSGGVQKEAYFSGVPCLTLRDETEWKELVEGGYNRLVHPDRQSIFFQFQALSSPFLEGEEKLYGHGNAADKITSILMDSL